MKHLIKYTIVILLMTLVATSFQSCKKQEPPKTIEINTYDALNYFQNCIIRVDSLGNFMYRAYGEPLNANDTAHLFIGVDSLAQAEQFFRQWLAPDIEIKDDNGNLTCPLTDKDGHAQGTVYFRPASSNGHIAEVSASDDTRLLYFRKITFMHNSVWPLNSPESRWHKFDIVRNLHISIEDNLSLLDLALNWVCVRESGNGINPMFCVVTNDTYRCYDPDIEIEDRDHRAVRTSKFCPTLGTANGISNMLQPDWDLFAAVFQEANGNDNLNTAVWVDETHMSWFEYFYSLLYYHSNYTYGETAAEAAYLLKIDWLSDEDINDHANIDG